VVRPAIKLYNAGSFFDPRAVPPADYRAIAKAVTGFSRVIVESHPALIGARVDDFLEALSAEASGDAPRLEVAMGLETAHPDALERLNKRMTVHQFRHAASELGRRGVALRVFVLVAPPFVPAGEQAEWLRLSVDVAFDAGATATAPSKPLAPRGFTPRQRSTRSKTRWTRRSNARADGYLPTCGTSSG
jgi:hypothetical protein